MIEGAINLNGLSLKNLSPPRERDSFEQEIRRFQYESSGGNLGAGARAALFLKGQIKGDYLLTLAYDSDKDIRERVFRDISPDEFYPVYGDSSARGYDGQTSGRMYIRVDKGKSFLLYGDYATGATNPARMLSQFSRTLTGAKLHAEGAPYAVNGFVSRDTFRQIAQELRFESSPDQPISYRLGASYLASQWNSVENQIWATPGYPPGTLDAGQLFNGPFVNDFRQHTGSEALFGLINWHVADQWRATLGLRETHETKDVLYGRTASAPLTKWNTLFNPPFAVTPLSFGATFMDGNASLQWSVTDSTQWYVTVGRGTKLGGFAETNGVPHADPAVDARIETEVTHDYELGVKSALLGRRLRLNAAVFDMEIDNFQDTTFNGIAFVTINLPARSRGAEWEVAWQVNDAWQIGGAATYADASENINGARFPMTQAPKWTAVASAEYARPLGATLKWRARIDGRYRAVMYNQRGGLFPSSSFDTIGVLLALEQQRGRWGVELVGRNLNNRVTADFSGPTPDPTAPMSSAPARLRTVTISGWARF